MESKVYKSRIDGISEFIAFVGKVVIIGYIIGGIVQFFNANELLSPLTAIVSSGLFILNGLAIGAFLIAVGHGLQYLKDIRDLTIENHMKNK